MSRFLVRQLDTDAAAVTAITDEAIRICLGPPAVTVSGEPSRLAAVGPAARTETAASPPTVPTRSLVGVRP